MFFRLWRYEFQGVDATLAHQLVKEVRSVYHAPIGETIPECYRPLPRLRAPIENAGANALSVYQHTPRHGN